MDSEKHTLRLMKPVVPTEIRGGKHAFTLIELLVVIAIIAILSSLLLPAVKDAKRRALLAYCSSNLHQIGVGMRLYINENEGLLPPLWHKPPHQGISTKPWFGRSDEPYNVWFHLVGLYLGDEDERMWDGADIFQCPELSSFWQKWTTNAYGYNWQVVTGTGDGGMMVEMVGRFKKNRRQPESAITVPQSTVCFVDAGYVYPDKYADSPPEEWAPMSNNPGFGEVTFPGNSPWPSYPGGRVPGVPVPMARHLSGLVNAMFFDGHVESLPVRTLTGTRRGRADCITDNK